MDVEVLIIMQDHQGGKLLQGLLPNWAMCTPEVDLWDRIDSNTRILVYGGINFAVKTGWALKAKYADQAPPHFVYLLPPRLSECKEKARWCLDAACLDGQYEIRCSFGGIFFEIFQFLQEKHCQRKRF